MKEALEIALSALLDKLKSDECVISDRLAAELIVFVRKAFDEQKFFTKTEVAKLLGCSTKTVDRLVAAGLLCKGHKTAGSTQLRWLGYEVDECKRRISEARRKGWREDE